LKQTATQAIQKAEELSRENARLHEENTVLSNQVLALKRNISCLYKTAKLEIDRKNAEIKDLRGQLGK
jgi:hypothetical protein